MKPRHSIVAVITRGEQILAVARHFQPHDINLPGGHADAEDTSPTDTLTRKIHEETGILILGQHLMESWRGEYDQTVYAYFVSEWRGRPHSSAAGKVFWARPQSFRDPACTFADDNARLLKKLMRV